MGMVQEEFFLRFGGNPCCFVDSRSLPRILYYCEIRRKLTLFKVHLQ